MAFFLVVKAGHVIRPAKDKSLSQWLQDFLTTETLEDRAENVPINVPGLIPFPCSLD